jgi:hypothetical protein
MKQFDQVEIEGQNLSFDGKSNFNSEIILNEQRNVPHFFFWGGDVFDKSIFIRFLTRKRGTNVHQNQQKQQKKYNFLFLN